MRILEINTIDTRGGAAKVAWTLKGEFERAGNVVDFFVKHRYSNDPHTFVMRWPSTMSRSLQRILRKDVGSFLENKLRPYLANDLEWFGTEKLLETEAFQKADIIHCHNLHGNYFSLKTLEQMSAQKPVIWTLHDMWALTAHCAHTKLAIGNDGFFPCESRNAYQSLCWPNEAHLTSVKKETYARSTLHIVAPCHWLDRKVSESILQHMPRSVIPNGIDVSLFSPKDKKALRERLNIPPESCVILFSSASGASREKGGDELRTITQHFSKRTDVLFLLIGDTKEVMGEQVRSIPFMEKQSDLADLYAAADIFLFPSHAETFPLSVLEAMSSGLPVVAFNVGGIKEAVTDGETGFLSDPLDTDSLINAIERLIGMGASGRKKMGETARARAVKDFSQTRMAESYKALYQQVLTERASTKHS